LSLAAREAGDPPLGQQLGRKLTPAIPTTRTGDAEMPADEEPAKFVSVHATFHNHLAQERHLID
jgi:hypothetical protein